MTRDGFEVGTRGRVPFALVGVLLVLSSALFASAVDRPQPTPEPAVDLAVERTTADARAAVRTAVAEAGVAAASDPVLTPANNRWGALLDPETEFEDALKVRIYRAARERLQTVARTHRGVRANASLAPTPTPEALRAAMERVSVERAGPDGTKLRAEISNVTVEATRNGRAVGTERRSFSVVVPTPVLAVHERVETYQKRLKRGVSKPGLGQRLTVRLYAVAWARGYAQYGGAPIENVVANRHVELMTNGAVLDEQRSVFGASDPDGRDALGTAIARVGLQEVVATHGPSKDSTNKLLQQGIQTAGGPSESAGVPGLASGGTDTPAPNETVNVSVGLSADRAYREFVRDGRVNGTIDSVYGADIRTLAATDRVAGGTPDRPGPPSGDDWQFRVESTDTDVVGVSNATGGPTVSDPSGYHRLETYVRTVRLRHERRAVWHHNGSFNSTTRTSTETRRVRVAVVGRHAPTPHAPDRPIPSVHERGGRFGGPNLADVPPKVRDAVELAGGPDSLAGRAARGTLSTAPTRIDGEWPGELSRWVYRDLIELRRTVREASVSVARGRMGTHEARPAAELAAQLRERRGELVDAPATYDSVAAKARAAVRGRYLSSVIDRVERRADQRSKRESAFESAIGTVGGPSLSRLRSSYDARRADERDAGPGGGSGADGAGAGAGAGGDGPNLEYSVDGAPPYLTLAKVTSDQVTAVDNDTHPLTARNVNYFSIPFADATDVALSALLPGGTSRERRLSTAARALRAANRTLDYRSNATVRERRDRLQAELNDTVTEVEEVLAAELESAGVGNLSTDHDAIVESGLDRWPALDARALAMSNGSVVDPIVAAAARRTEEEWSTRQRDWVRLQVRTGLYDALESKRGKVSGTAVTTAAAGVKDAVGQAVKSKVSETVAKRFNESVTEIPAGLPVAPPIASWWVTTNVWSVTVRGQYARFAVEVPRRTPAIGDASLQYVRDGGNATLDLDGDGASEVLGRSSKVTFTTRTAVTVVVPPGGTGVGDIDGNSIEQSKGWPIPGPDPRARPWTGETYPLSINGTETGGGNG
ncbi:DUF7286 family protein [Halosimplex pelagicum]|uniref:Uncharacterized protein n=1 Tax=Halosimplex pelagicum TaxID=869886 RepID=A0A7D5P7A0_9EURY|nr:hypothetical protein [Halosimplex pelagicum]QLH82597.1 hypothetical protein HZS54_13645 [Halosimplex pelagicum]